MAVHCEHPREHSASRFTPSAVRVTITLDSPFKMSERHVGGKRPNRERQVAPRAVSHLHLVQADVIVNELTPSSQPATSDVDKVGVGREQLPGALHVVSVPGVLPALG